MVEGRMSDTSAWSRFVLGCHSREKRKMDGIRDSRLHAIVKEKGGWNEGSYLAVKPEQREKWME